jgi:hypothetical protein
MSLFEQASLDCAQELWSDVAPRSASKATDARFVPRYAGAHLVGGYLPQRAEPWLGAPAREHGESYAHAAQVSVEELDLYASHKLWTWPGAHVVFVSDLHADADAFCRSLVASGAVEKTGPGDAQLRLTESGRDATFVIGGDCFDKGPSSLRLLRMLQTLMATGARVRILAGNHDLHALLGMSSAGESHPLLAHFFVRMGVKLVPLLRELVDSYRLDTAAASSLAEENRLCRELFPQEPWYRDFPQAAAGLLPGKKLEHELLRIREKTRAFEAACAKAKLSLAQVMLAIEKFKELFLTPGGEFHWYFSRMELAHRCGSLLFVHAGVDDHVAAQLHGAGVEALNLDFRRLLTERKLFELYHGPMGNTARTKYRDGDFALSERGVQQLHGAGIHGLVHGHRNLRRGQRMILRNGMLNFECDASVDCNTRAQQCLAGAGGAATVFSPDGVVMGISTDHPRVKVFDPAQHCRLMTLV